MRIEIIETIPEEIIVRPAYQSVTSCLIKCDICDKQISDDSNDRDIDGNYTNVFVHKEESTCIDGNHKSTYTEYDFCSECFDKIAIMFNVTPTVREEPW